MQDSSDNTTLYHTARITAQGGSWSVESSHPSASECEEYLPDGATTEHPAMGAVQQPIGWKLVGIIDGDDGIYGVFEIEFETDASL